MWVLTLNYSASMHDVMTNLTGIVTKSSEQHTDLRASRRKQDEEHGLKFTAWLQERNLFGFEDENLHSLSTGIISMTLKNWGFIKTTEHRPTDHRPTDQPTTYHLPTDPPINYY